MKLTVPLSITAALACLLGAVPSALTADTAKPAASSEVVSIFPDPALESAVRRQVFAKRNNHEPITAEDVADIAIIEGRGLGIKSLAGLEHCRKLALLNLAENEIADLTPLAGLPRLQSLDLSRNQIKDLQPLVTNTALQYLDLSFNRLRKIEALAGLTNLAALLVSHNRLADASPAFGLPRLNSLHLDGNRVRSLEGIGALKRLDLLSAAGNRIRQLAPLKELTNLRFLSLEENRVRDLQPLVDMAEKDAKGGRHFAPFLRLYLQGNRLDGKKARTQLARLREIGVKVHIEPAG